jgi:hypothetical protein
MQRGSGACPGSCSSFYFWPQETLVAASHPNYWAIDLCLSSRLAPICSTGAFTRSNTLLPRRSRDASPKNYSDILQSRDMGDVSVPFLFFAAICYSGLVDVSKAHAFLFDHCLDIYRRRVFGVLCLLLESSGEYSATQQGKVLEGGCAVCRAASLDEPGWCACYETS